MAQPNQDKAYFKDRVVVAKGDMQFAPFEFINDKGQPDGFSVELFRALMKKLNIRYTLDLEDWGKVQGELNDKKIDLAIGMIYSQERAEKVRFGIPHCMISYNIVCRKDNDYLSLDSLKGKQIIVQKNDRAHEYLIKSGLTDQILLADNIYESFQMLSSGQGEAVISFDVTSLYFIRKGNFKNLRVHLTNISPERYSMVVNTDNEDLLYLINAALYQMKIEGEYDNIYYRWFGVYEGENANINKIVWYILGVLGIFLIILVVFTRLLKMKVNQSMKDIKAKNKETMKLLEDLRKENQRRIIVEKDLTVAKEKAEEGDRLKSAFLANMSHEIRTPLNAIVGFSELLQNTDDHEERAEYMNIIQTNSELLLRLIGDILDLSKIESGLIELKPELFDLSEVFDNMYITLKQRCVNPEVEFLEHNPCKRCLVKLDKNRLTQVVTNFVTNAFKHTERGYILMGYEYMDGGVRLYVEDTGCGIPKEKQNLLFHRFMKLDDFTQGTGLGLAICKAIADVKKGKIGMESEEGKGSTFWCWFPCQAEIIMPEEKVQEIAPRQSDPWLQDGLPVGMGNKVVLVAEDNDSNYKLVQAILKATKLTWAKTGAEAVELASANHYDVILMDMRMPVMGGLEATRKIRIFDQVTPIIAVTAYAFDTDREEALKAGCNAFITKPIKKEDIEKIVCSVAF